MRIPTEKPADTAESVGQRWPARFEAEHQEQWEGFKARWNDHSEAVSGPLEVQWAQLDREPPFAVVGREGSEENITVALGRSDSALKFIRTEGGRNLTLPSAARALGVGRVEMDRAAAAILDGLEQSERIAGRSPADPVLTDWVDLRKFDRYLYALESGYITATKTLADEGINADAVRPDSQLSLSDDAVQRFAVLGRSATANAAAVLARGDEAEDLMVAVEVLTGNPWERSNEREELEEQLNTRLRGIGLHEIAEQSRRTFNRARVHGIGIAGGQISGMVANGAAPHRAAREPMRRVRAHAVVGRQRARRRTQYAEYMASGAWHKRRRRWIEEEEQRTGEPVRCAVCDSEEWDDLHHLTYDRMGQERHGDMVALCRPHHDYMHRAYDAGRWRHMSYDAVMRRLLRLAREDHERRTA